MINIFFIILGLISITYVYKKVKKNLFSEKESLLWMIGAILVLLLSIFPKIIDSIATLLDIKYSPSLLFLLSSLFLVYMIFRQSQDISQLNSKVRELAQKNAIIEKELTDIRSKNK